MVKALKERLVGAAVLIIFAVIVLPLVLTGRGEIQDHLVDQYMPVVPQDMPAIIEQSPQEMPLIVSPRQAAPEVAETEVAEQASPPLQQEKMIKNDAPADSPNESGHGSLQVETEVSEHAEEQLQNRYPEVSSWVVQVGSFAVRENAETSVQRLKSEGFPAMLELVQHNGQSVYRVRVGPMLLHKEAEILRDKILDSMMIKSVILPYRP